MPSTNPKKASKPVAKNRWMSKIFKPIVTPKQLWEYRGMLQKFDSTSHEPGKYSTFQLFQVHNKVKTSLDTEIDPKKKVRIRAEKDEFENLQWKNGDYGNPKRILETLVTPDPDGRKWVYLYNVDNGQSLGPPESILCQAVDDDKIWQMAYAENIDGLEFSNTDGEKDEGDSDFDSDHEQDGDDELGGGKKRRIQRTPTNKRNTKKRRCKKSSKTKKRNMKRYHNANTKTNRKKRVP